MTTNDNPLQNKALDDKEAMHDNTNKRSLTVWYIIAYISGLFKDLFGTYDEAFYVGAGGVFLGGIVLVCGNTWKICRERRARRKEKLAESPAASDLEE